MADETDVVDPRGEPALSLAGFRLVVVDGREGALEVTSGRATVGTHASNDLVLEDRRVSRFHCELVADGDGVRVRDLGSRNGTYVDGVRVLDAFLRDGSTLKLGGVALRFEPLRAVHRVALSPRTEYHGLVARSVAMRAALAWIERAARSEATVLLEGETGTGKGKVADAIHRGGPRAGGPFLVVDCGAVPPALIESELYGHERSAFTGASERRIGAFEEADGGTLFLDEIGELPLEQQPKLLRALEEKEIRRVGANAHRKVNVRIVAATNRDLRREVNEGRFRADLYYRLAVLRVALPPLRERAEDLEPLARALLEGLGARPDEIEALCAPDVVAALRRAAWPGNVRELRNHLERCLVFEAPLPLEGALAPAAERVRVDASVPYALARRDAIAAFERGYVTALLERFGGKVAEAASAAGMDRVYLHKLLRRHR